MRQNDVKTEWSECEESEEMVVARARRQEEKGGEKDRWIQ